MIGPVPTQQIELIPISDGQAAPRQKIGVRLPSQAETNPALDKIVERLGLAGQLAKINAVNTRYTKEDVIPIVKQHIELDIKKLKEAKDDKAVREAVQKLEDSVQMLKELLSLGVPAQKKP